MPQLQSFGYDAARGVSRGGNGEYGDARTGSARVGYPADVRL